MKTYEFSSRIYPPIRDAFTQALRESHSCTFPPSTYDEWEAVADRILNRAFDLLDEDRTDPDFERRFLVCNKCGLFSRPWPMTPNHRRDWDEHHFYYCKKPAKSIAA